MRSGREHWAWMVVVEEEERRGGGEEQATDIKPNNPHLTGGEICEPLSKIIHLNEIIIELLIPTQPIYLSKQVE